MRTLSSQTLGFICACVLYLLAFLCLYWQFDTLYALLSRPTPYEVTSIALSHFEGAQEAPTPTQQPISKPTPQTPLSKPIAPPKKPKKSKASKDTPKMPHKERAQDSRITESANDIKSAEATESTESKRADSKPMNSKLADSVAPSSQAMQANEQADIIDEYAQKIYELIDRAYVYPQSLQAKGIRGEVRLKFGITQNGELHDVQMLKSDNKQLEQAALRILKQASHKFPKPQRERKMLVILSFGTKRL